MIGIDKARKILGKKAENLTDEQIVKIENTLHELANIVIDRIISMTPAERKVLERSRKEMHEFSTSTRTV